MKDELPMRYFLESLTSALDEWVEKVGGKLCEAEALAQEREQMMWIVGWLLEQTGPVEIPAKDMTATGFDYVVHTRPLLGAMKIWSTRESAGTVDEEADADQ